MRTKISKNIGFDDKDNTFFCLRCGKAGYDRMPQVRGHLSQCIGTQRRKGIPVRNPTPANTPTKQLQPLDSTWGALAGASPGGSQVSSDLLQHQQLSPEAAYLQNLQLADRVAQLENHLTHVIDTTNPAPGQDWFSRYKGWVILVGVVVVALIAQSGKAACPNVCGTADSKPAKKEQPGFAEKALSKVADRLVIKGVDSIFKHA